MKKMNTIIVLLNLYFILTGCKKKDDPVPTNNTSQNCTLSTTVLNDTLTSTNVYNSNNYISAVNYTGASGTTFSTTVQYDSQNRIIALINGSLGENSNYYYTYGSDGRLSSQVINKITVSERDSIIYQYPNSNTINSVTYVKKSGVPYDTLQGITQLDANGNILKEFSTAFKDPAIGTTYPGNKDTMLVVYQAAYTSQLLPSSFTTNLFPDELGQKNTWQNYQYYSYSYSSNQIVKTVILDNTLTYQFDTNNNITKITENASSWAGNVQYVIKYLYNCQ